MSTTDRTRTTIRKKLFLGSFAAGLLLLSGLLLLHAVLKSGPTVTGFVRVGGNPLDKGSIRFVPVKGTTGSDAGAAIHQGKYQIEKGLTVGKYKVEIQGWHRIPGKKVHAPIDFELIDAEEAIVFEKSDPIICEVGPGHNQGPPFDFVLKEDRKRR
jgi:hypothetical protein